MSTRCCVVSNHRLAKPGAEARPSLIGVRHFKVVHVLVMSLEFSFFLLDSLCWENVRSSHDRAVEFGFVLLEVLEGRCARESQLFNLRRFLLVVVQLANVGLEEGWKCCGDLYGEYSFELVSNINS